MAPRQMVTIDRWFSLFAIPRPAPPVPEQQRQHASVVPPVWSRFERRFRHRGSAELLKTRRIRIDDLDRSQETAQAERALRMLMLEECRLRICGNSDSVRLGGLFGRRLGGEAALKLMRESIDTVVIDPPAAAHGELSRYV